MFLSRLTIIALNREMIKAVRGCSGVEVGKGHRNPTKKLHEIICSWTCTIPLSLCSNKDLFKGNLSRC